MIQRYTAEINVGVSYPAEFFQLLHSTWRTLSSLRRLRGFRERNRNSSATISPILAACPEHSEKGMKNKPGMLLLLVMTAVSVGWLLGDKPFPKARHGTVHVAGNMDIDGSINVLGTKNFRIDHPLDPKNRYLVHFASEGPEPFNIYAGRQTMDESGSGWVLLPPWFEAINIDFRYQLTAIGGPAPDLHVMTEIENNRFQIGGGPMGGEVSWEVRARRNDPVMQRLKPGPEIDKPSHLRGSLLDPLAFADQ